MSDYDCFCEFAWMHLEDVFDIGESDGIPDHSPYFEFVIGCAAYAIQNADDPYAFGFSMDQVLTVDKDNLVRRFFKEYGF